MLFNEIQIGIISNIHQLYFKKKVMFFMCCSYPAAKSTVDRVEFRTSHLSTMSKKLQTPLSFASASTSRMWSGTPI